MGLMGPPSPAATFRRGRKEHSESSVHESMLINEMGVDGLKDGDGHDLVRGSLDH